MSKPVKKDKKNDSGTAGLQLAFQSQKRQLLDCQFSIKKFQQRLNDVTGQNILLRSKLQQSNNIFNESLQQITLKNMANQKRLLVLSNQKTKLQIENQQKQNKIKILQKNIFDQQQFRLKDYQETKKNYNFQLAKYQSQLSQYKLYMNQRDQLQQQRQDLRQKIQIEKANKLRDIADKEKQKVQATDKLKDQMLHKINQMRKNLFSLKRQQLSTTTRLTMLQNHQLTSELQYQSKQTENIIFKNQDLQQKILSLKQQLDIHKEVQQQLAKRAHFSKGIIKKLNIKINQLQNQVNQLKNQLCMPLSKKTINKKSLHITNQQIKQKDSMIQQNSINSKKSDNKRHIRNLQQTLEKTQKLYSELSIKYSNLHKQKQQQNIKLQSYDKKANELFKILHKYYIQIIPQKNNKHKEINKIDNHNENLEQQKKHQLTEQFINQHLPFTYDLKKVRSTPLQRWSADELTLTVQILLNLIQPYIVRSNLLIPAIRKNIIVNDSINKSQPNNINTQSNKSLPKLLTQRRQTIDKVQTYQNINTGPGSLASKIVNGNLREWGQTLKLNKTSLTRKYKLSQSYRG